MTKINTSNFSKLQNVSP